MKNCRKQLSVLYLLEHINRAKYSPLAFLILMLCFNSPCYGQASEKERIMFDSQLNSTAQSFELFSISPNGNNLKQHTFDAVRGRANTSGQLSPNRKHVIFGTYRYGGYKVAIANSDFSEQKKLTKGPHYTYVGSWSPDSRHIVYTKVDTKSAPYFQGDLEIFIMSINGISDVNISNTQGTDTSPKWSPDGKKILFCSDRTGNSEIYTMEVDGTNVINLTNTPDMDEFGPSWSPDAKEISFHSMKRKVGKKYIDLYIMNAEGANKRNLTNNQTVKRNLYVPYYDGAPPIFYQTSWSSKGNEIAFSSKRNSQNFQIFIIKPDGSGIRQLTHNTANNVFPFWYSN